MRITRRDFVGLLGSALLGTMTQAGRAAPRPAWRRGAGFLAAAQGADGAWRSAHYGVFREGDVLTPLVLVAMQSGPVVAREEQAVVRGARWLDALTARINEQPV